MLMPQNIYINLNVIRIKFAKKKRGKKVVFFNLFFLYNNFIFFSINL
jgi:hypothetical protein